MVVIVVIFFTIASIGLPLIGDAGDSFENVSFICENSYGCFYNNTHLDGTECVKSSSIADNGTACSHGQPVVTVFSSFFRSSGIIMLAIMGMLIIGVIAFFKLSKKGR